MSTKVKFMGNKNDFFENKIPNLELLKIEIENLENLDLSKINVSELKKNLDRIFPIIPFTEVIWDERFHIYRARRNNKNAVQEPFNYLSEIGMLTHAKHFGRANNPDQPIFYGSHNEDLTLFECCQNVGQFDIQNFTMGIWKVKKNEKLKLVLLNPVEQICTDREDLTKVGTNFKANLKDLRRDEIEYSLIVSTFFSQQFTKNPINANDEYKISAYFSNYIQDLQNWSKIKFDGIIYPSVANKFRGENVAIFKNSLDKLEFTKALSLTCYNFDNDTGKLTKGIFNEGYLFGDSIRWHKGKIRE